MPIFNLFFNSLVGLTPTDLPSQFQAIVTLVKIYYWVLSNPGKPVVLRNE